MTARDAVISVVVAAVCVLVLLLEPVSVATGVLRSADLLGVVLVLISTLPLAARRRRPVAVLTLMLPAAASATSLGYASLSFGAVAIAAASAVVYGGRRLALPIGLAGATAALTALAASSPGTLTPLSVVAVTVIGAVPSVVGLALRTSRELAQQLRDRAEMTLAARDNVVRAAVAEERTRIAQDVHDIVGHYLSAMVLQAGAGRRTAVLNGDDGGVQRFKVIEELGSKALHEARRTLGVLRSTAADLHPLPGLSDIPALIDTYTGAGVQVEAQLPDADGDPDLSPALQTAAYRIVQEALTNVAKHSLPRQAHVLLSSAPDALHITVSSPSSAPPAGNEGNGLVGMNERASSVGGTLRAGPDASGWSVTAHLPVPGRA